MDITANYTLSTVSSVHKNAPKEDFVAFFFIFSILSVFFLVMLVATFIRFTKPEWLELGLPATEPFTLADISCLNVLAPCTSCNFRTCLNGCCPRMNLKQRLNCFTNCENRPDSLNLVCCSV